VLSHVPKAGPFGFAQGGLWALGTQREQRVKQKETCER
jgi:hypothetical protein